jgi:hypothetical protein
MDERPRAPHHLRFARAIVLVSIVGASATAAAGCSQLRERIGCEHCRCPWDSVSVSRPLSCDVSGPDYCCTPVEGPLPPPDLPV